MQPSGSSCFLFSPRSRVDVDKKTNALIYVTYPSHVCSTWNQGAPIQWCLIEGLGFYLGLLELKRRVSLGLKLGPCNERNTGDQIVWFMWNRPVQEVHRFGPLVNGSIAQRFNKEDRKVHRSTVGLVGPVPILKQWFFVY